MKYFWLIVLGSLITGCSNRLSVHTDTDPDYDLWSYKTFDWGRKVNIEDPDNPIYYNELNDKRIKTAVLKEMTERGYFISEDNPDLLVHYHIIVEDQSTIIPDRFDYMYGPYWTGMNGNLYTYKLGTLIIDIMDTDDKHLIWRGWAEAFVDRETTPRQVNKLIKEAIDKMFKKFPRRPDTKGRTVVLK